jgi:predicted nucleotidyltransferase component of viral defense system
MMLPRREDALHKAVMYRLLSAILDDKILANNLFFKGGTAAAMLGRLNRFSIDLDFDLRPDTNKDVMRKKLVAVFQIINLTINQEDAKELFFILKYTTPPGQRNTLKLSAVDTLWKSNTYEVCTLPEIDRMACCQTIPTMFANKLVALIDRYEKYGTIAGRDCYDIWYFFQQGFTYRQEIIRERRGTDAKTYFTTLKRFIENHVTETVIGQDLNTLLPVRTFQTVRKVLKTELLMFIADEISRLTI